MTKRLVIVGAGFAGLWSALAAARRRDLESVGSDAIDIVVVAPEPELAMRPRLYEAHPETMTAPLGGLFEATGVRFVAGTVEAIRADADELVVVDGQGVRITLAYDRLVLAAGSRLHRPQIPGLVDLAFSVDQRDEAVALDAHLQGLPRRTPSARRDTVVVVGGGFTGLELAAELPGRLRGLLGEAAAVRVVVLEQGDAIGPGLGEGPRPIIARALADLGVEYRLGAVVIAIDPDGVTTAGGDRVESHTVIWTAGLRASPLTLQVGGNLDPLGRVRVGGDLRSPAAPKIFLAGDTAVAATDDAGHDTLMSCQHAMMLGRSAGDNALADLLGLSTRPYSQPGYVTCLDLGPWGAVFTQGWDRTVQVAGADAKAIKRKINGRTDLPARQSRPGVPAGGSSPDLLTAAPSVRQDRGAHRRRPRADDRSLSRLSRRGWRTAPMHRGNGGGRSGHDGDRLAAAINLPASARTGWRSSPAADSPRD